MKQQTVKLPRYSISHRRGEPVALAIRLRALVTIDIALKCGQNTSTISTRGADDLIPVYKCSGHSGSKVVRWYGKDTALQSQVVEALVGLGFTESKAATAVEKILEEQNGTADPSSVLREALQRLSGHKR